MLVLSRKKNETIIVTVGGERIKIAVVQIDGDKVRIGVEADRERVEVHRGEVQDAIDAGREARA